VRPKITALEPTFNLDDHFYLENQSVANEVMVGVDWLRAREYPRPWENGYFYLATYYSAQATAQVGGDTWNEIFPQIARNLIEEQGDDGSWPLGGGNERRFGSTYSTSLAVLALTPAYQLLPIYQR